MNWGALSSGIIETVIYSIVGILLMGVGFFICKLVIPFSIRKEIEEDQNVSLAVIIGAVIIGVAIIIASVVGTPTSSNNPMPVISSETQAK